MDWLSTSRSLVLIVRDAQLILLLLVSLILNSDSFAVLIAFLLPIIIIIITEYIAHKFKRARVRGAGVYQGGEHG